MIFIYNSELYFLIFQFFSVEIREKPGKKKGNGSQR
jgi:hypothetical protein